MLNIFDKVATIITNTIVVATTFLTTLMLPIFMYGAIVVLGRNIYLSLCYLVGAYLLIKINKSVQGGE